MLNKILHKIGICILGIIGTIVVLVIVVPLSDIIFHWAGPEGAMFSFGYALGHLARSIVNLF